METQDAHTTARASVHSLLDRHSHALEGARTEAARHFAASPRPEASPHASRQPVAYRACITPSTHYSVVWLLVYCREPTAPLMRLAANAAAVALVARHQWECVPLTDHPTHPLPCSAYCNAFLEGRNNGRDYGQELSVTKEKRSERGIASERSEEVAPQCDSTAYTHCFDVLSSHSWLVLIT
jgi:hypothetical protein